MTNLAVVAVPAAIAILTLVPQRGEKHLELVPFAETARALHHPFDLASAVANVAIFVPVGALLALRTGRARAVLAAAAFSATIEVLQLAVPGRTTSVDDLIWNTTGAALGAWLAPRVAARFSG